MAKPITHCKKCGTAKRTSLCSSCARVDLKKKMKQHFTRRLLNRLYEAEQNLPASDSEWKKGFKSAIAIVQDCLKQHFS